MKRYIFNCLIILIIFTVSEGCSPLQNLSPADYSVDRISKKDYQVFNGTYNNRQDTVFGKIVHIPYRGIDENNLSLADRLYIFFPDQAYGEGVTMKFEFISKNKAIVSAYQNGEAIFTKNLRGRIKKNYFYVRPRLFFVPFFPVVYVHDFERVRIGKIENDIIVDHTIKMWGFALFAGGSDSGLTTSIYKMIDR